MSKYLPTKAQQAVIDHEGSALLVSAAAGAGKTKVLVERLLRKVCDPLSPCNVDDFLIITYTKAAAAELRTRIAAEISERLAKDSGNRHLRNQLTRIYLAEISTVHSFCSSILRDYAYILDIPSDFRVAEEAECTQLRQKAVEQVMEQLYEELDSRPNVVSLLDNLGRGRDDRRLISFVLAAYDKIRCHADPDCWVQKCRDAIHCENVKSVSETLWGEYLLSDAKFFLQQQLQRISYAKNLLIGSGQLEKYIPVFDDDEAMFKSLLSEPTWENLSAFTPSYTRLPPIRNCEDVTLQNEVLTIRDVYKTKLKNVLKTFSCDASCALADLKKTGEALDGLLSVVDDFEKRYTALKRQRRVLDFSDLEHLSIRLLTDKYTKKPTAAALEIGEKFKEIMVDEYQDSNQVQDTIFQAVSREGKNLFMVGDVKQSIYSFRLADPGIFLEKYHTYSELAAPDGTTPRKIFLSENFRSREEILSAANHVFRTVMSEQVGDLNYGDDEALRTGGKFPPLNEPAVELHCIDTSAVSDDGEGVKKQELEARFVAKKIRDLIENEHYISDGDSLRRIRPEDIVILMRSVSSNASIFMKALAEQGIVSNSDRTANILDTTEVSALLSWLQIIDNPHQDIPLAAAMLGPLGGYSADDLAKVRVYSRSTDLFDALTAYSEETKHCTEFLQTLYDLRQMRAWTAPAEFFDAVCRRVNAFEIFGAMPDGLTRVDNLNSLRSFYQTELSNGTTSLSEFLRHIEYLQSNGIGISSDVKSSGGVTIMTVHKSKGLEFPVVFLCDLSRKFNMTDLTEAVLMDKDLLVGCNVFDKELMLQYPSVAKNAIAARKKKKLVSEELRVLYVAMTRAKDRLIMTYSGTGMENHLQKVASSASYPLQSSVSGDVQNPGQWILYAAAVRPEARHVFGGAKANYELGAPWHVQYHDGIVVENADEEASAEPEITANDESAFVDQPYTYQKAVTVPAKLTATQIKGRGLDAETSEQAAKEVLPHRPVVRTRTFLPIKQELSAAEKGISVHLFMQYCRYENCLSRSGICEEKKRLLENNFLTKQQIDAVSEEKILRFFASDVGRLLLQGGKLYREFKFSLLVDAETYYPDAIGEKIMMQGVVDCFVITPDGIVVLDFKTDAIRPGEEHLRTQYYRQQLTVYGQALERIFELPVVRKIIYYFHTDTVVEL